MYLRLLLVIITCLCVRLNAEWLFLPTFQHTVRGIEKLDASCLHDHVPAPTDVKPPLTSLTFTPRQLSNLHWHRVTFPHSDFVQLMPEHHVFGWYVHPFKWPPIFHGLDANIRLGVTDDADETYVNGTLIGKSGVISGSSAWQQERHYLLPSANISPHSNLLACHVWSKWGMGGILGQPILTASLMKNGQSWKRHTLAAPPHLEANGLASPQPRWTVPPSSSSWHPVPPDQSMPDWSGPSHYAIYRTSFSLADLQPFRTHVILELGSVLDVTAVYLNHRLIGQVGRFSRQPPHLPSSSRDAASEYPSPRTACCSPRTMTCNSLSTAKTAWVASVDVLVSCWLTHHPPAHWRRPNASSRGSRPNAPSRFSTA